MIYIEDHAFTFPKVKKVWKCPIYKLWILRWSLNIVSGKSKRVFHDRISEKFSFDVCADGDRNSPDSIRLFDHSDNTSLSYGLTNKGIEHMVNNENIGKMNLIDIQFYANSQQHVHASFTC